VAGHELEEVVDVLRSLNLGARTLGEQRRLIDATTAGTSGSTTVVAVDAGGVACEWVSVAGASATRTVIALRGGGYCLGSLTSNRRFCELLGDVTSARVLNVGYRNAPEHPYPAALDDARAAYEWLQRTGTDPASVVVAGNSAGGGLALALLLALRDRDVALPAAAAVISPWTDLANTGESIVTNAATEVMLDPAHIAETAARYVGADHTRHPYVSPIYGDFTGLPPLIVQASTTEILRDDAVRLADRARSSGVDVTLELTADMPHVWHLFAGLLPEADDAMLRIGMWLDERLASTHPRTTPATRCAT